MILDSLLKVEIFFGGSGGTSTAFLNRLLIDASIESLLTISDWGTLQIHKWIRSKKILQNLFPSHIWYLTKTSKHNNDDRIENIGSAIVYVLLNQLSYEIVNHAIFGFLTPL